MHNVHCSLISSSYSWKNSHFGTTLVYTFSFFCPRNHFLRVFCRPFEKWQLLRILTPISPQLKNEDMCHISKRRQYYTTILSNSVHLASLFLYHMQLCTIHARANTVKPMGVTAQYNTVTALPKVTHFISLSHSKKELSLEPITPPKKNYLFSS